MRNPARTDDGDSDAALSRWLPDAGAGDQPGWLAAVRADPGRAGAIVLGAVGVVAVLVTVFTLLQDKTPPVASAKLPPVEMVSPAQPTPSRPCPRGTGRRERRRAGAQAGPGAPCRRAHASPMRSAPQAARSTAPI